MSTTSITTQVPTRQAGAASRGNHPGIALAVIVGWQFSANNLPGLIQSSAHVEGDNEGGAAESGGEEGDGNGDASDEGDSDKVESADNDESADGDVSPEETSGDQESDSNDDQHAEADADHGAADEGDQAEEGSAEEEGFRICPPQSLSGDLRHFHARHQGRAAPRARDDMESTRQRLVVNAPCLPLGIWTPALCSNARFSSYPLHAASSGPVDIEEL